MSETRIFFLSNLLTENCFPQKTIVAPIPFKLNVCSLSYETISRTSRYIANYQVWHRGYILLVYCECMYVCMYKKSNRRELILTEIREYCKHNKTKSEFSFEETQNYFSMYACLTLSVHTIYYLLTTS